MRAFIEKYYFVPVVLIALLAGVSALREHDARILAEQHIKESEQRVAGLKQQVQDVEQAGADKIRKLQKRASAVKTPVQAIQAIPEVSTLPLAPRELPDAPSEVAVQAVPLFQELAACKQTAVGLGVCTEKLALTEKIVEEKQGQVDALKHPRGFWKRFGTTVKDVGIGVAIGYGIHAATNR